MTESTSKYNYITYKLKKDFAEIVNHIAESKLYDTRVDVIRDSIKLLYDKLVSEKKIPPFDFS